MPATIFSGPEIKALKSSLNLNDAHKILTGTDDPTSVAKDAPLGSKYIKTDSGDWYRKLDNGSSTNWELDGSGSGAGGINYILNPDFETGTDGWVVYDDGAVAVPVDGTGGSPTVTFSRTAGQIIRGSAYGNLAKGGAVNVQGQGLSYDFSVDRADYDRSKRLTVSFEYQNGNAMVNGDIVVYIYDVTNSTLLGVVENDNNGEVLTSIGDVSRFIGSFETVAGASDYRLILHYATTSTGNFNILLDSVSVSPDVTVPGAIVKKPQPFTPNFPDGVTLGNGTVDGSYWREGQFMMGYASLTLGSTTAITGGITFEIPDGELIDTNVALSAFGSTTVLGDCQLVDNGTASHTGVLGYNATNKLVLNTLQTSGSDVVKTGINATTPFTWANTDIITLTFKVPIEGWAASAALSTTEANLTTAQVQASMNVTSAVTIGKATFNTVNVDNLNIVDATADDITIPRSGRYLLSLIGLTDSIAWNSPSDNFNVAYRVNGGSWVLVAADRATVAHTGRLDASGSIILDLNKGDTLEIGQNSSDATISAITMSLAELPDFNTFSVYGTKEIKSAISSVATPAADNTWLTMTGNSLNLSPGTWELKPSQIDFGNSGSSPSYDNCGVRWSASNGTPTDLNTISGLTVLSSAYDDGLVQTVISGASNFGSSRRLSTGSVLVELTEPATVYLVAFVGAGTFANARVTAYLTAERKA